MVLRKEIKIRDGEDLLPVSEYTHEFFQNPCCQGLAAGFLAMIPTY
jgi:hypothetical protein